MELITIVPDNWRVSHKKIYELPDLVEWLNISMEFWLLCFFLMTYDLEEGCVDGFLPKILLEALS